MIMADRSAMHIVASLKLSIIALFGDFNSKRWRPWAAPCTIIQNETKHVKDIEPAKIMNEWLNLMNSLFN
jgi:ADP-heptose:LPS heptosyltransferase